EARREGIRVLVRPGGIAGGTGIVLLPVHGHCAAGRQKACDDRVPEQGRRRQVVDLAREDGANDERVDEVVRVVDAEEYRPPRGDSLGRVHVDALPEEPEPEARGAPHHHIEGVDAVGARGHPRYSSRNRLRVSANAEGVSTGLASTKSTRVPRSRLWSWGS